MASRASIWKFAKHARSQSGIHNGFDLPYLIKANAGQISPICYDDDPAENAIVIYPDGKFDINLSDHMPAVRNHFTLTHELGHFLLHWPLVMKIGPNVGMKSPRVISAINPILRRCEKEADCFAMAFLMPKAEFKHSFAVGHAAEKFAVTAAHIQSRAKDLTLI